MASVPVESVAEGLEIDEVPEFPGVVVQAGLTANDAEDMMLRIAAAHPIETVVAKMFGEAQTEHIGHEGAGFFGSCGAKVYVINAGGADAYDRPSPLINLVRDRCVSL